MEGPVSIREIKYLEKSSCVSVNVYGYDQIPYPYYISEFIKKLYHVDVLLHNNHYYLIRNMSTFASGEKSNRRKCYVCQYCLCYFVKKERYDLHVELCVKGGHQYEFPHKDAAQLNFSNYSNIVPASFVMYCDLEAMITKDVKVNRGKIQNKSVHVPIAVGAITVCRQLVRDCIEQLGRKKCHYLSIIDLRDAFHTLQLALSSQKYCGITPYYGSPTYHYLRMGMSVSPQIWQQFIDLVFQDDLIKREQSFDVIMDDMFIHSTAKEHMDDLIDLFKVLRKYGLKLSPHKCQFFK